MDASAQSRQLWHLVEVLVCGPGDKGSGVLQNPKVEPLWPQLGSTPLEEEMCSNVTPHLNR